MQLCCLYVITYEKQMVTVKVAEYDAWEKRKYLQLSLWVRKMIVCFLSRVYLVANLQLHKIRGSVCPLVAPSVGPSVCLLHLPDKVWESAFWRFATSPPR